MCVRALTFNDYNLQNKTEQLIFFVYTFYLICGIILHLATAKQLRDGRKRESMRREIYGNAK